MYVCICRAITKDTVQAAIDAGADSVEAVTAACCAGDDCGTCHETIEAMIDASAATTGRPCRRLPVVRAA